jgi:iron-sulfur cluster repair protein YtfE (RIC family)
MTEQLITRENWKNHPDYHRSKASFLIMLHDNFRRTFIQIEKLIQTKNFSSAAYYYNNLCHHLHGHYSIEEAIMFPSLEEKMKIHKDRNLHLVKGLYSDHHEMTKMMDELEELFQDKEAEKIPEKWKNFTEHMMKHLDEEENISIPIMIKYGIDI